MIEDAYEYFSSRTTEEGEPLVDEMTEAYREILASMLIAVSDRATAMTVIASFDRIHNS